MPKRKPSGQVVVVPKPEVIEPTEDEKVENKQDDGLLMGPLGALTNEMWSVRPPSRIEPTDAVDEFPLPPLWTVGWHEEWDDLIYPPFPDEVTESDTPGNPNLGSPTVA